MKPGFTTLLQNQDLTVGSKKSKEEVLVVKPSFTTLLQNQDSLWEAKKRWNRFWGETWFHNIVAKPGFTVGSKNDGTGFGVKPGFTTLLQNQDSLWE